MRASFDDQFYSKDVASLCGVDEAGRGPLAGPVVAAAVILPRGLTIEGLRDSKRLSPKKRLYYFEKITSLAHAWSVGMVGPREIEEINILRATIKAMEEAVQGVQGRFDLALIDGRIPLSVDIDQMTLIKGDEKSTQIAAASIIAKVTRDRIMEEYHGVYPNYNFKQNKGYGTREHKRAIRTFGPCPIHRKTFRGVIEVIGEEKKDG
jgi:ribonuclease HII